MIRSSPTSFFCAALAVFALAGCANTGHRAPVEERTPSPKPAAGSTAPVAGTTPAQAVDAAAPKPLPGAENAGKPGYYTVKPGDTLIRVALETGQNWRDIARWSSLDNPNVIEVGQVLRVIPPAPAADTSAVVARPVAPAGRVEGRPLDGKHGAPASAPSGGANAPAATAAPPTVVAASAPTPTPSGGGSTREPDEEQMNWAWPAAGPVATPFDEARSRGVAITGKAGDPVMAAADGRVIYAGSGLRGYGNLVIIKHNSTFLTAYAHNQTLVVKEDQAVRRGQKIAEMGSSDAERVQLHFEIRRQGKPVDPTRLLPTR